MHNAFELLARWCDAYGYPVLFLGVMLENAGLPVPGETAVLVAGFLASDAGKEQFGVTNFHLVPVILVVVVAAVLGDNMGFWLGRRWARPRLQNGRRFLFLTAQTLATAERYFARYGTWTIFFARFITGLRVIGAMAAGTAGMSWPRFLLANASGAVVWSVTISLLGFFFGEYCKVLEKWLTRSGLVALVAVVLVLASPPAWRRLRSLFTRSSNPPPTQT